MLTCCTEDAHVANYKVDLTFNVDLMESSEGQMKAAQIPPGAVALISIETEGGDLIVDEQEVTITQNKDGYVTTPLRLPKGSYRLVDLMVLDESGEVAFVTPREGSELSQNVKRYLPYEINEESSVDTRFGLIDTRKKAPKHFGYDCFRGKQHNLKVQVFIAEENSSHLQRATAEALIMKGLDTLRRYKLNHNMNFISFKGNPGETYTLVVVKDSYARFAKDFKINQISGKPLKVVLQPAFSVVGITTGENNHFGIQFDAPWIFDFHVDWGDGTTEIWTSGITTSLEHYYAEPGHYFVSVTGNGLDSAVYVGNLGSARIQRLGMKHLIKLTDFRIEYSWGPEVVDLRHNKLLNVVSYYPGVLEEDPTLRRIRIPNDADIYQLELVGSTNLESESLNGVIDAIHHQIVTKGRQGGDFLYHKWEDPNAPVATPSEASLEKLREMKHTYNWLVVPDPDGIPF